MVLTSLIAIKEIENIVIFFHSRYIDKIFRKFAIIIARMAELVDAHDSGSCVRKDVQVRFLFRALF